MGEAAVGGWGVPTLPPGEQAREGTSCSAEATQLPTLLSPRCPGRELRGPFSPGSWSVFPPPVSELPVVE